jgi:hypothetical protein
MTPSLKIKVQIAKTRLGKNHVLHPAYERCHWHTPRHRASHVLFNVIRTARNLGRID